MYMYFLTVKSDNIFFFLGLRYFTYCLSHNPCSVSCYTLYEQLSNKEFRTPRTQNAAHVTIMNANMTLLLEPFISTSLSLCWGLMLKAKKECQQKHFQQFMTSIRKTKLVNGWFGRGREGGGCLMKQKMTLGYDYFLILKQRNQRNAWRGVE